MGIEFLNYFRSVSDVYGNEVLHRVMEYTDSKTLNIERLTPTL